MIAYGIWMIISKKVGSGTHRLTQQDTGAGGELLILIGLILTVIAYLSLSPFSRLRSFFEGKRKKNGVKEKQSK